MLSWALSIVFLLFKMGSDAMLSLPYKVIVRIK